MPHHCVKCSREYGGDAPEVFSGCSCGARAFVYVREHASLPQLAADVRERIVEAAASKEHSPLLLQADAVRMLADGEFDLDVTALLHARDTVYMGPDGQYVIDCDRLLRKDAP